MKKKIYKPDKVKVSIAIPARNEEGNISALLEQIYSQKRSNWQLSEVIVICDGCQDRTAAQAESFAGENLQVKEYKIRKGKVLRINQILKTFKGEILLILDADIRIKDNRLVENLVKEFSLSQDVKLVGGNVRVYPPETFFQKAILTSYRIYYDSRDQLKNGHNVFGCSGACLALRQDFAKNINLPQGIMAEDVYFYLDCLKQGFEFRHSQKAVVYHKLASNIRDFLRQMFRSHPESVKIVYTKYFGDLVSREFNRPWGFYLKSIFKSFVENPVCTIYMIVLKLVCKPLFYLVSANYKLGWFTAASTKWRS